MKQEKSEMGDRNGRLLLDRQEIDAGRAHKTRDKCCQQGLC